MQRFTLAATAACAVLLSFQAQSATYVLHAAKWGAAQDRAVAAAGGKVTFSHGEAGVAVAQSDSPGFLAAALAAGAITGGQQDMVIQWQDPIEAAADPVPVNPLNDSLYAIQWAPGSIGAPTAWAAGWTGLGVRVAIIDGGIYHLHPDLAANLDTAASRSFVAPTADPCAANKFCDLGTFWHGTHVAGIVAAVDNATGVVGIAPRATIFGVKALHGGSGSFAAVMQSILYAGDQSAEGGRADVMNLSLGAVFSKQGADASALRVALKKAVDHVAKSTLVVVATGNDGLSFDGNNLTTTPAESGHVMAVSATAPIGWATGTSNFSTLTSYANYGRSLVSIAGPGGDTMYPGNENCVKGGVVRPCWVFDLVLSTSRAGYSWAGGTSMAAPAVAAVAALVKQKYPGITVDALQKHLQNTASAAGSNATHGAGYVNAAAAVAD